MPAVDVPSEHRDGSAPASQRPHQRRGIAEEDAAPQAARLQATLECDARDEAVVVARIEVRDARLDAAALGRMQQRRVLE